MSVRLFIGNLPYSATDADLRTMFSEVAPPLQVVLPVDRETGRPRGFAFVDFAEREAAEKVIEKFNGAPLQGRPIAVSEARAREDRPAGPRPGGPGGGFSGPRPGGYSGGPPSGGFSGPRPSGGAGGPRPFAPRDPMGGMAPPGETRRQRAKPSARKQTYEKGPRGPIKERPVSRLYDDEDDEPVDLTAFDDPAASSANEPDDTDDDE